MSATTDAHLRDLIRQELHRLIGDISGGGGGLAALESGGGLAGGIGESDAGGGWGSTGGDAGGGWDPTGGDSGGGWDSTGGDQMTPTYLTIDSAGKVGALFTGGLQLIEGSTPTYTPANAIGWKGTDGVVREFIVGDKAGSADHSIIVASLADATHLANLQAISTVAGAAGSSNVTATATNGANTRVVTVVDDTGASDFLQLLSTQKCAIAFGSATWTWPAASNVSNTIAVAHGLTRVPAIVVITPNQDQGAATVGPVPLAFSKTTTQFTSRAGFPTLVPGAGATASFSWLAIG